MLNRQHAPSMYQKLRISLVLSSATMLLTACGGSTLNTKNAETFDASLSAMTKSLDEAERRKVAAAVILLTDNADMSAVPLGKVQNAANQAGGLLSNDGDSFFGSREDILGEMILEADGRLNGKNVKDLVGAYETAKDGGIALDLKSQNTSLEKIATEEAAIEVRKKEIKDKEAALKEKEKSLIDQGNGYGRNFKITNIRSATSRGIAGHGHATFTNVGDVPFDRPKAIIDVTWKSDSSIIGYTRLLSPGYDKNSSAVVKPGESKTFRYDFGLALPLPEGTAHTKNKEDYIFNISLAQTRNITDRSAISFRLNRQDARYIQSVPNMMKRCEVALERAAKRKTAIQERINSLSNGKIDDLGYISGGGSFTC